MTSLEEDF